MRHPNSARTDHFDLCRQADFLCGFYIGVRDNGTRMALVEWIIADKNWRRSAVIRYILVIRVPLNRRL
jgi:hypothetical protein